MTTLPEGEEASSDTASFDVHLTFQGQTRTISVRPSITGSALHQETIKTFHLSPDEIDMDSLKLLYKGKRIPADAQLISFAQTSSAAPAVTSLPKKTPKIMVMASQRSSIQELSLKRSDPTIRGFEQEKERDLKAQQKQQKQQIHWGPDMVQDKNYKFCRFQACTWQSFGHRPTDQTPHAFEAMKLLEKLATDPGVVAVMKERELVVGTLGEMDPIDDRLMRKTQQERAGGCLLGYNTNGGARIDIKLRTDDIQAFRPYPDLVATLIHELSHNWVGEHNLLFWTNYAQMRAEYLYTHARLRSTIVRGKTTAELAGLDKSRLENVLDYIMLELAGEMRQHGLHPQMIEAPIRQRIQELERDHQHGQRLGGTARTNASNGGGGGSSNAREMALAAAERRARDQNKKDGTSS
ncbi:WLM domain containing protein [Nitzschia inconspicua]|uniref:WLM domain containing protein n=1 Tax=Nitzschia inconspicua TaxID=303405 RepID=A0A9K3K910_9STRA|nr:WLM domain containing protein [Nitzschia inconspicua]KAG7367086.1 WLM domain containing protein [Nitzschia inconspicua]